MAKTIKTKWIGARFDDPTADRVEEYLAAAEDLSRAELLRKAVLEYMANHPLKKQPVIKPGV